MPYTRGLTESVPFGTVPSGGGVLEGLRLLEDDSLGGGGSRGSGRVSFANLRLVWRGRNYYASGAAEKEIAAGATVGAIQSAVTESAFGFIRED